MVYIFFDLSQCTLHLNISDVTTVLHESSHSISTKNFVKDSTETKNLQHCTIVF